MTDLEREFHSEMENIYYLVRDKAGYRATRYLQMVRKRGGLDAAKRLLSRRGVSTGFKKLAEIGALDVTMEALILRPEFIPLFTDKERAICRDRLLCYGYDPGIE